MQGLVTLWGACQPTQHPACSPLGAAAAVPPLKHNRWPEVSDASLDLCERLLLPRRDPMPPVAMLDGVEGAGGPAGGVREHDVQVGRHSPVPCQLFMLTNEAMSAGLGILLPSNSVAQPSRGPPVAAAPLLRVAFSTRRPAHPHRRCAPAWAATGRRRWLCCAARRGRSCQRCRMHWR